MKQVKPATGIKKKIVGGFLLLLTLIFLSVFSVIKLATTLTPPDPGISSSALKLTLTSNLLSSLIEADGQARAYISTSDPTHLSAFYDQQDKTRQLIDSLEKGSISNTSQYLRIVAVDSLITLKEKAYANYFELRQNTLETGSIDIAQLSARYKDTIITIPNKTINKTITQQVREREQTKKKGFFPRLWDNITGRKKSDSIAGKPAETVIKYDTVTTFRTTIRDNTLNQVKSQLRKYEQRKNLQKQLLAERELMLVQADQDIMNEIRAVLLLFEKEEINKAISETEKSHNILDNLWKTALILAGAGLLATIGFLILIWKDLAKSAFYRRQSEEARSLAESLLKVKEQFLANMSHEIRTPLTSIIGFTERLNETQISKEQSRYIKYISSSSEHLLELINDLLDFSKIDSGKLNLELKPFDPEELFSNAFETLAPRAKQKDLETLLKLDFSGVILNGDPLRLRQIVINLLSNSIKFTDKGKIVLQTKTQLSPDKKSANLTIRVADTGIGIPDDKLEYIFEEFSQVDHSITRKYGGSGLGLAITKKLVDLMDGTLNVVSRENQGTIFTVKLKLPVSKEIAGLKDANVAAQKMDIKVDLKEINILLAEDDPTTRLLLREFLEQYNSNVFVASDGDEALQIFKGDPSGFDLIITDIQMPGISGVELINKITGICKSEGLKLPVVLGLTAHADNREIEAYRAVGINYLILKPFRNKDLQSFFNSISISHKHSINEHSNKNNFIQHSDKNSNDQHSDKNSISQHPDADNKKVNHKSQEKLLLDLSSFRKFTGDDEDSLNRIIASLNENLEKTLGQMYRAFEMKDFKDLSILAHRLQPNIKLLGAKETAAALRDLEVICKNETPDDTTVKFKLDQIAAPLRVIQAELKLYLFPAR
ncbi:MAG TPA: ATP-binding protein [Lentimicrobium sp.]|nr:ATP-binding protein [Lentimicrobium sp.]